MSSLYKNFATDKNAEVEGVWIEEVANEDGTIPRFKIARMSQSNPNYTKALKRRTQPVQRLIDIGTLPPEQNRKLFLEVFLDAILLVWENVQDRDGTPMEFNRDNARRLYEDLPDLALHHQIAAQDASRFRKLELEDAIKN